MMRIEHAVWCARSEGDLHGRAGGTCEDFENVLQVAGVAIFDGIADPDCFRWQGEATGASPLAYAPTRDRDGRVVRIALPTILLDFDDERTWLATVGPLMAFFELYADLWGNDGKTCYKHVTGAFKAFHAVLIVGYDDLEGCWIAKNSWYKDDGKPWGDEGFFKIAYGECRIDEFPKIGLRGTNPDPWTKRRLHNGCLLESGNGPSHRDFELFHLKDGQVRHRRRENSTIPFSWRSVGQFAAADAATMPAATASTYDRDFELVYRRTPASGGGLRHWRFSQAGRTWVDGAIFGPSDAAGVPGFIQSNHNAPGDFEVVVKTSTGPVEQLSHWTRENGYAGPQPRGTWYFRESFGSNVATSGPALLQSHVGISELPETGRGRLEVVCVLNDGFMEHFSRDPVPGASWQSRGIFGDGGAHGPPCMIEGQFHCRDESSLGDFELCVAVGTEFQHWHWSGPPDPKTRSWSHVQTFGSDVKEVVALIESSFTFQLELIVLRTDDRLQHYWRDGAGWHVGDILP